MRKAWLAQMDVHVDQPRRHDETARVDLINCRIPIANFGFFADAAVRNHQVADCIAPIRGINDAAVANDGRIHRLIRGNTRLSLAVKASRAGTCRKDRFSDMPKPTREAPLTSRFPRINTRLPYAPPGRWSPDRESHSDFRP